MRDPEKLLARFAAETREPAAGMAERALARLEPELRARRRRRRRVLYGLPLVAALSLPLVLTANAAGAWLLHALLDRYLPDAVAVAATSLVGSSMLLVLALAYGSLPILASWGLRLQEQTP